VLVPIEPVEPKTVTRCLVITVTLAEHRCEHHRQRQSGQQSVYTV
jgi:hypothetical protein